MLINENVSEFSVGCSNTLNNAGWLSGSAVVYKIKLENEILQVEGIDKNKKVILGFYRPFNNNICYIDLN